MTTNSSFLITACHFFSSRWMFRAYSAGVLGIGSPPASIRRFLTSSDVNILRSSVFNRSMIGCGVVAGATSP